MSTTPHIPPELVDSIIGYALDNIYSTRAGALLARVSSHWLRRVNSHRFHLVNLEPSTIQLAKLVTLLEFQWAKGERFLDNIKHAYWKMPADISEEPDADLKSDLVSYILMELSSHTRQSSVQLTLTLHCNMYRRFDPTVMVLTRKVQDALYTLCCDSLLHTLILQRTSRIFLSFICKLNVTNLDIRGFTFQDDYAGHDDTVAILPNVHNLHIHHLPKASGRFVDLILNLSQIVLPALQELTFQFIVNDLSLMLSLCGSRLSSIKLIDYPLEENNFPAKFKWPARMEALQSLHISTSRWRGSTNRQAFLNLDKYLPASLPPFLGLIMTLYPFPPTTYPERIEKDTIVEVFLRIMNRNFDTASLRTLLRDLKHRKGTVVKLSIQIDHIHDLCRRGNMDAINQMLHENLHLFRSALEIVPEFVLDVAVIDTRVWYARTFTHAH